MLSMLLRNLRNYKYSQVESSLEVDCNSASKSSSALEVSLTMYQLYLLEGQPGPTRNAQMQGMKNRPSHEIWSVHADSTGLLTAMTASEGGLGPAPCMVRSSWTSAQDNSGKRSASVVVLHCSSTL